MNRNAVSPFHPRPEHTSGELHLPALPTAPGHARRFVREQLHRWLLDEPSRSDLENTIGLVTSELVTNAVAATDLTDMPDDACPSSLALATVVLRLRITQSSLYIDVWDNSPSLPIPKHPDSCDENGRGLALVTALVKAWDWYPSDPPLGGKVIWAEIGLPAGLVGHLPPYITDELLPLRTPSGLRRPRPKMVDAELLSLVRSALRPSDHNG